MKPYYIYCIILSIFTFCFGCKSQTLPFSSETKYGTFKYTKSEITAIGDLIKTCDENLTRISHDLNLKIDKNIIIEIYPNQATYDRNIINHDLKGSPAISGNGIIQLVSPSSKIKIDTISYPNRLLFIIHEYVHLMIDQLDSPPPVFLDEGLACYYGSYDFYYNIVKENFREIETFPTIEQLQKHYYEIPAADLFSFLVVDFLINSHHEPISTILRYPDRILSENSNWIEYMMRKYN